MPSLTPNDMQALLANTGLTLNPGQMADLVLAWRQVAAMIAAIPRDRPMADDQAFAFRLAPPAPVQTREPVRKNAPARKKAVRKKAPSRKPVRARR
ncbi:MAG: hypothetical protein WBQ75_10530 [Acetobacteraceae bacterium]